MGRQPVPVEIIGDRYEFDADHMTLTARYPDYRYIALVWQKAVNEQDPSDHR